VEVVVVVEADCRCPSAEKAGVAVVVVVPARQQCYRNPTNAVPSLTACIDTFSTYKQFKNPSRNRSIGQSPHHMANCF